MIFVEGFQVQDLVFETNSSLIYRATRSKDQRPVIIKLINREYPEPELINRFRREYHQLKELNGEGCIKAYDLKAHGNGFLMILEDYGGNSIYQSFVELGQTPDIPTFLKIAIGTIDCLEHIHHRVIHKDINPSNILYNPKSGEVKLIDFGIASLISHDAVEASCPSNLEGTLPYMSPEQTGRMNRILDYRSDFYSLGITFFELLSGILPFEAEEPLEWIHCHIAKPPKILIDEAPWVPQMISKIIHRLISKRAEHRYQSIHGIRKDLMECLRQWQLSSMIQDFPLSYQDASGILRISEKLYGREETVQALLKSFERAAAGGTGLHFVGGYAGIGKSSVIREIHKPIVERQGLFMFGKFDQYRKNEPYSALFTASSSLIRQVLSLIDDPKQWQESLQSALGNLAKLLTSAIPELEHLLGDQPDVPVANVEEERNRFSLVFRRFLKVFAKAEHPLVLFLDDMQWADAATLDLLPTLCSSQDLPYVLFLGSYRDNEIDDTHPLSIMLSEIQDSGIHFQKVILSPLNESHVSALLEDSLYMPSEKVHDLVRILMNKTAGNPFFINEFLKMLYREHFLSYDMEEQRWTWDTQRIEALDVTDNVVDLLMAKINKLPDDTQVLLRLAACVGNNFESKTLAVVAQGDVRSSLKLLMPAIEEGFIIPLSHLDIHAEDDFQPPRLQFRHDRIQQAAYSLIPEGRRPAIHLHIGRLLLRYGYEVPGDESLFDIANHMNLGRELLDDPEERLELAKMNLNAGLKAKAAGAHEPAINYLDTGLRLLPENAWESHYKLMSTLVRARAECSYLIGKADIAEQLIDELLKHSHTDFEKAELEGKLLVWNIGLSKIQRAIARGIDAVRRCGISFPGVWDSLDAFIPEERKLVAEKLEQQPLDQLFTQKEMTDPLQKTAVWILQNLTVAAYTSGDLNLFKLAALKGMNLLLEFGHSELTTHTIAHFCTILRMERNYRSCYEFATIVIELLRKDPNCRDISAVLNVIGVIGIPLGEPLQHAVERHDWGFHIGFERGEITSGTFNFFNMLAYRFACGEPLENLVEHGRRLFNLAEKHKVYMASDLALAYHGLIDGLLNPESQWDLSAKNFQEEQWQRIHMCNGIAFVLHCQLQLKFWRGQYEEALAIIPQASSSLAMVAGYHICVEHDFLHALILTQSYDRLSPEEQRKALLTIRELRNELQVLACQCPENYEHKFALVQAELGRVLKRDLTWTLEVYERAQMSAQKNGFPQYEALTNEFLARYWLSKGKARYARVCLNDAIYGYQRWGADTRIQFIEDLSDFQNANEDDGYNHSVTPELGGLDLETVIKAYHVINGQIVLTKLLEKLLAIVIENAGATAGSILLFDDPQWYQYAHLEEAGASTDLMKIPLSDCLSLSQTIVNYVIRTSDDVILNDASTETLFTHDPYIQKNKPKSLLCLPITHHGKVTSILYLENNLSSHVFTEQRVELLKLLTNQAAIAIENAQLYRNLEDYSHNLELKVDERTKEILRRQDQLIAQEKMASLGALTAGVAHEICNPLNFIINMARNLSSLVEELKEVMTMPDGQEKTDDMEELIVDLLDSGDIILQHGNRASEIVGEMMKLAQDESTERRSVDLNALLREYTNLALKGRKANEPVLSVSLREKADEKIGLVDIFPQELARVFLNLINNARESMVMKSQRNESYRAELNISTERTSEGIVIRIHDNGVGIESEIQDKVFTPFFTTKPTGMGNVGLGLSVCLDLVHLHQGQLTLASEVGEFTTATIVLPLQII